jgi:filamentous hemagglutinin family protein
LQAAVASCFATAVHANPVGPSVVSGAATFNAVGKNLTVTNSPGTIINWQGFSIRPDEVTRFIQPGAASAVLNRVTGPEHSALLGQLLSNGRVFLINPNGVTVGAGARIDTAGFVASSLNLSNEDFLAGKFRFTDPGSAGKVTNAGTINTHSGGSVYLVAPTVENHGVITAPNGEVMLAAGKSVELVSTASPDIRVHVQAGGEALNVGQLVAESGRVGIFGAAIRNAGVVSADSATVNAAGNIVLKATRDVTLDAASVVSANGPNGGTVTVQAEGGTLLADGRVEAKGAQGTGGEAKLLGERVGLVNQASVDASGRTGGGTVLVGGDYQGRNPDVQNARVTYVAPDASLVADAGAAGDGGKVIVWADGTTRYAGAISARGGAASGNGGFAEVSGKDSLEYAGVADLRAPSGTTGTLLLDPKFILIQAGGPDSVAANNQFAENAAGTSVISGANLATAINTASVTLQANTDITVDDNVTAATANRNLTLQAGRSVVFNPGRVVTLNDSQFIATVNDAAAQAANRDAGAAQFLMNAGSGIVTQGKSGGARGNVAISVGNFGGSSAGSEITMLGGAAINTNGTANRAAGTVTITGTNATTVDTSGGTISANGGIAAAAGRAGGAVAVTGGSVTTGAISTRGSDGVGGNSLGGTGGALTLTANAVAGALQVNGAIDTRGGNSVGTGNTGAGGAVTLRTANNGTIASTAAGTITTTGGRGQTGGNFTVTSLTPATDTVATVNLAGGINVDGGLSPASGTLGGKNAGTVSMANVNTVTVGAVSARGSNAGGGNNAGGNGGAVNIDARGTTPGIALTGAIDTRGGDGTGTGNAGNGGSVRLRTTNGGAVTSTGAATITTAGGRGQIGGSVTVSGIAAADTLATADLAGAITTDGGVAAASGTLGGKNAGAVSIGSATSIALGPISTRGSNAGGGNNAGGNGGGVTVNRRGAASTVTLNGAIDTRGGDSTGTGNTGTGGNVVIDGGVAPDLGSLTIAGGASIDTRGGRGQTGGAVTLRDFTTIAMAAASVDTSGGAAATNGGASGQGKNAGAISITGTGAVAAGALTARGSNAIAGSGKAGGAGAGATITGGGGVALNGSIATVGGSGDGAGAAGAGGAVSVTGGVLGGVTQAAASTVDAGAATILVDANDGAINLTGTLTTTSNGATAVVIRDATTAALGNVSAANGRVVLGQASPNHLSGAVTQNGGTAITAASLSAVGGNTVTLANANQIGTLAGATATGGLTLNNGNNPLTVSGNVTTTNSPVAISVGTGTYTQNNNIDISAGAGGITLTADQIAIGTNGGNALATSGTLTLKPSSAAQPMRVGSAAAADAPGTFDLRAAEITAFATGATGPIVIGDAAASTAPMTVAGAVNLAGKTVTLNAGSVTDAGTQTITAQNLGVNARTGAIGAAGDAINVAVTNLRVTTQNQNAYLASAGGYNLGAAPSSVGTGTLGLAAGGAVTQSAGMPITAGSMVLTGAGGNFTLTQNNSVGTLAANTGAVAFVNGTPLTVGTVNGVAGVTTAGNVTLQTAGGAGNDITLANNVAATGAGANVTLASGEDVHYGTATLAAGAGGRWLTYSGNPANDTGTIPNPGNAKPNIYNCSFGGPCGATIPATGNHHVYSYQPTLTYTADPASRQYGDPNPAFSGTVAGLVNGDTAADAYAGTLAFTSPATPTSGIGSYAIDGSGLTSDIGYAFAQAPGNATALTIGQRALQVTADAGQSKIYGEANPAGYAYTLTSGTLVGGDALSGATTRVAGENVGNYAIQQGTLTAGPNYALTFVANNFAIVVRPITITANPGQTKVYGGADAVFAYGVVGGPGTTGPAIVAGDSLVGALGRAPGENVGPYAINQGTLAVNVPANYAVTFVATNFTITPAALTIAADNKARAYGDPNPPLTASFTGLTNGDTPAAITGLGLTTPAVPASNVGSYAINVTSNANANYTITYVNGQLTISAAPLTIAADDKTKTAGQPNPPFTATFTGFKLGQTVADLTGALSFTTPATTGSPAGSYPITPGGVSSTNYAITFVDGQLVVTAAPLPPTPPGALGGVATADNALITATQRSVSSPTEGLQPNAPRVPATDCLVLETPAGRRVLNRCF